MSDEIVEKLILDGTSYLSGMDQAIAKSEQFKSTTSSGTEGMIGKLNELGESIGLEGGKIGQLGSMVGLTGTEFVAGAAGITAMTEALHVCVEAAAPVQQNLVDIGIATGQGSTGLGGLEASLRGTTVGMGEGSAAALQLSDTYKKNDEIVAAMPGNIALSEAAHMSLGQAIGTTTGAITKFNLSGKDTSEVANLFVAGAQHSKESAGQLGEAVGAAGIVAKNLGMDIGTTTAVMAEFSQAGLQGSNAGQTFSMSMKGLTKDSKGTTDALAEMGLTFSDIDPQAHSFDQIVQTLSQHHITLKESQELFSRGGQAMYAVINQQKGGFEDLKASITGTEAATEGAETASSTYEGSMKKLGASVEDAEVAIGNTLLPVLADFITVISEAVTGTTQLGEAIYGLGAPAANAVVGAGQAASSWLQNIGLGYNELADPNSKVGQEYMAGQKGGEAFAKAEAEKIANDPALKKASGDALSSEDAMKAARDAADKASKEFTDRFGTQWEAGMAHMVDGTYRSWDAINTQIANEKGGVTDSSGQYTATTDAGMKLNFRYTVSDVDQTATISAEDGTILASKNIGSRWSSGYADEVAALLASVVPNTNTGNVIDLTQGAGRGDVWRLQNKATIDTEIKLNFDWDKAKINALPDMKGILEVGTVDKATESYATEFGKSLEKIDWANLPGLVESGKKLAEAQGNMLSSAGGGVTQGEEIAAQIVAYKQKLVASITDMTAFAKDQSSTLGKQITDSMADSVISDDDRKLYTAMVPMLETIKAESPKAFGDAGLTSIQKFAEMAKDGATTEQLVEYYKKMGLDVGQSYTDALTGKVRTFKIPSVADILNDPNLTKSISNLPEFLENKFQPALKKSFDDQYELTKTGQDDIYTHTKAWIADIESAYNQHADWFNSWQKQLLEMSKNGSVSADNMMYLWDQMQNQTSKSADGTQKQTSNILDLAKAFDTANSMMSQFGQAQEANAKDLFKEDYVGGDTEAWDKAATAYEQKVALTQYNVSKHHGVSVGMQYPMQPDTSNDISGKFNLDTAKAIGDIATIKGDLNTIVATAKDVPLKVTAATSDAQTAVNNLIASIKAPVQMPISLVISAVDLEAMVTKILSNAS